MLKKFITQFTSEEIVGDFTKVNNEYFVINESLKQIISQIKTKPSFAGIHLGIEKGKTFVPSLYLLQKLCTVSNKKIITDKKGEWMFICGKNIFQKSIIKFAGNNEDLVLVQNEFGECLGYGKITTEKSVQHIFDIGDFLRRER